MSATITLSHPHDDAALVTLAGEVDLAALEGLEDALSAAAWYAQVVVDAAGVDFIDCAALRPLVACARAVAAGGGTLRLRDPSPALRQLITWCDLGEELGITTTSPDTGAAVSVRGSRVVLPGGAVLDVSCSGRVGGRVALVLHGEDGPASAAPTVDHLGVEHQVIAPTHPGWEGTTRGPGLDSVAALARAYLGVLAGAGGVDVVVVGISFGGWVGAQMAIDDEQGRVAVPALVVSGSDDEVASSAYARAWAGALGRSSFTVVSGGGHLPCQQAPGMTCAAIDAFLSAPPVLTS